MFVGAIYPLIGPTFGWETANLRLGICRVFYEQIRQMTRMSRQQHEMNPPVSVWLQCRMFDYNLTGVILLVNFQESGDYARIPSSSFPRG